METLSREKVSGSRSSAMPPVSAAIRPEVMAALEDTELLHIVRSQPWESRRRAMACEVLVSRHRNLVRSCVQRYRRSPEPAEDLTQVGYVGLLKAINNFDPAFHGFRPAPQPGTRGELYSKAAGEPGWEPLDRYEQRPHALSERRLPHIHHARRLVQRRRIGVVRGPRRQLVGWNRPGLEPPAQREGAGVQTCALPI